jgi:hypothetical protein
MTGAAGAPRTAALTQTHDYRYRLAVPGGHAACRMRVYARGDAILCLATEHHDRFTGSYLAAHAIELTTQLRAWHQPGPHGHFTWIEHDEYANGDSPAGSSEQFALVTFAAIPGNGDDAPTRRPLDHAAVEALLGQTLSA